MRALAVTENVTFSVCGLIHVRLLTKTVQVAADRESHESGSGSKTLCVAEALEQQLLLGPI